MDSKIGNLFESRQQISNESQKLVADMSRGKPTQIQTAVFQSSGNLLSLFSIDSFMEYCSNGIINDNDFDGVIEVRGSGVNFTEYMMKYCNRNKYNSMSSSNNPFISSDPISEIFS